MITECECTNPDCGLSLSFIDPNELERDRPCFLGTIEVFDPKSED